MKARFVILVYSHRDYLNPRRVIRTGYDNSCDCAIVRAKGIYNNFKNNYVEVWDVKTDKLVWMP
jgi:hypothetical protein